MLQLATVSKAWKRFVDSNSTLRDVPDLHDLVSGLGGLEERGGRVRRRPPEVRAHQAGRRRVQAQRGSAQGWRQ